MKIDELEEKSRQPRRLIRYLIAQNIIPEPHSLGRNASYGDEHLRALHVYTAMKAQGISSHELIKQRIRSPVLARPMMAAMMGSEPEDQPDPDNSETFELAPGVELKVDRNRFNPDDMQDMVDVIRFIVNKTASGVDAKQGR